MDIGITKSSRDRVLHWITGSIVLSLGYCAALLAIRVFVL
jgi:hypothetical protein